MYNIYVGDSSGLVSDRNGVIVGRERTVRGHH